MNSPPESMDTADSVEVPAIENENNNLILPNTSAKHCNIFLENNIPLPLNEPTKPSQMESDPKRALKPKSLADTIEALRQSAVPLSSTNTSVNACKEADSSLTNSQSNGLSFSKHSSRTHSPRENTENLACSLISSDIICNCDGVAYLSPNDLSSKLLRPDGVLNELSDVHCSPFPLLAKSIKYCCNEGGNTFVICYSVTTDGYVDHTVTQFVACLPCRYRFEHTEQLIAHGTSVHHLSSNLPQHDSRSSAVIQQARNQPYCLSFLKFDEKLSFEELLSRLSDATTANNNHQLSVSTPPGLTNKLPPTFCEDHPDGGIECPKCDLVLGSTRSLGGKMLNEVICSCYNC